MAKHGHITDEDRALFRRATGDVRRMDDDRAPPVRTRATPRTRSEAQSGGPGGSRELAESEWASNVGPGDVLSFARGGVRRREIERLRRGRFKVEADLDLHGRIVAEAVPALDHFLRDVPPPRAALRAHRPRQGVRVPERCADHEGARRPLAARPLRGARVLLRAPARRGHRRALRAAQTLRKAGLPPMPAERGSRCVHAGHRHRRRAAQKRTVTWTEPDSLAVRNANSSGSSAVQVASLDPEDQVRTHPAFQAQPHAPAVVRQTVEDVHLRREVEAEQVWMVRSEDAVMPPQRELAELPVKPQKVSGGEDRRTARLCDSRRSRRSGPVISSHSPEV